MRYSSAQPRGFSIFFLTEMWERYGFYIIQTLLILYFVQKYNLADTYSYGVLGSFTALAYINPILGGFIADRILGAQRSILVGAVLISCGYVVLALMQSFAWVFLSLGIVAMGTGMLKPNISSLLGRLYADNDARRHAGYALFYVGIYVGIMLATVLGGYIQRYLDWQMTFYSASAVLLIAFATFSLGSRYFKLPDSVHFVPKYRAYALAFLLIVLAIGANTLILQQQEFATWAFTIVAVISFTIVIYEAIRTPDVVQKNRLFAYFLLVCISIFFWAIYFQLYFSMNLFVARVVDRTVFGFNLPPSFFVGIEALGVIVFGPLMSQLWHGLERRENSLSTPMKFALGLLMMTISFALLFVSSLFHDVAGQVVAAWVVLVYLIIAIGELLLSPTGLAMVTELAPKKLSGMMMGIFFVSLGLGGKLAGVIASFASISTDNLNSLQDMEATYHHAFGVYLVLCVAITFASFVLVPLIKRLIHRVV